MFCITNIPKPVQYLKFILIQAYSRPIQTYSVKLRHIQRPAQLLNIQNLPYFESWQIQSSIVSSNLAHFLAASLKVFSRKIHSGKKFSQKNLFLYFTKCNILILSQKKCLKFWQMKLSTPKNKKFQEGKCQYQKLVKPK